MSGREPEDGQRFSVTSRGATAGRRRPSGRRTRRRRRCRRRSAASRRSAWTRPATAKATRASPWSSTTNGIGSIWAHDGYGRDVFGLFFQDVDARTARLHQGRHRRRGPVDRPVRRHEWCPNAERAPDGFHIVSWTSDAPDKVRKRLWNQARRDGDEKTTKRMRGVRYTVLKNPGELTDRRSEASGNLRDTDPKGRPYRSWRLREPLRTPPKRPGRPGPDRTEPPGVPGVPFSRIPEIVEPARRRSAVMGPTSSGQPNWAVQTPGSRRPTTGSRSPSAWPTASTTRTIPSP